MFDIKSNVIEMATAVRRSYFDNSDDIQESRVLPFANYRKVEPIRRLKVLIAHHQPIMVVGIGSVVEQAGHEVITTCCHPSDLGAAFVAASPDVMVLAASFCERNEPFLSLLKARDRFSTAIVIGEEAPIEQIGDYMAEGVGGIVTTSSDEALLSCIRAVAVGERWVDADFRDRWKQLQVRRSG